jgi:beta-glucosidase
MEGAVKANSLRFPEGSSEARPPLPASRGAVHDDGRGPSIWDTFQPYAGEGVPELRRRGLRHYHRYRDDVALMAELGLGAYRFSVAWPRIQPDGTGPVNPRGLDFYDRLVDELIGRGIDPIITLYHWDLPQTLEDRGGWTNRDTAEHFADYAVAVHARLGDRVRNWTTLNEPWCSAYLGYGNGVHAPGGRDAWAAFTAVHHLLLGHGLAARALRAAGAETIGITLNPADVRPPTRRRRGRRGGTPGGRAAQRIFLDPLLRAVTRTTCWSTWPSIRADLHPGGRRETVRPPIDLLGSTAPADLRRRPARRVGRRSAYPGTEGSVEFLPPVGPLTDMGWMIEPAGLTRLLERIATDYPGVPLMITENGAAFPTSGRYGGPGRLRRGGGHRPGRVPGRAPAGAHAAIARGVDLRGYLVWSLLDNFEWAEGYRKRFGIVHVDYLTQRRTLKESARWYQEVISRNGL